MLLFPIFIDTVTEHLVGNIDCLKKNQNAPRPSEHPPVKGEQLNSTKTLPGVFLVNGIQSGSPVI